MSWLPKEELELKKEEEEEEPVGEKFDQSPVRCTCPNCGGSIITFIDYEPSWLTYLMALVVFFSLGWFSICVLPLLWPIFKDVVHHCPRCLTILARRPRVQILSNGDGSDVMTMRCGSCAIVLSRKYVVFFVCIAVFCFGLHTIRTALTSEDILGLTKQEITKDITWEAFVKDCGGRSYLGNPIHVQSSFATKYKNHTFEWEGIVENIQVGFNYRIWVTASTILIDMPVHAGLGIGTNDITLVFPTHNADELGVTKLKARIMLSL